MIAAQLCFGGWSGTKLESWIQADGCSLQVVANFRPCINCLKAKADLSEGCQAALTLLQGFLCLQKLPVTVLEVLFMCKKVFINICDILHHTVCVGIAHHLYNNADEPRPLPTGPHHAICRVPLCCTWPE